jgi:DNA-binding NtrC family response regulator
MRYLVREVMAHEGYEVDTAKDGVEAVQMVREQEFDLLIMDVKMPRMDGIEALREIRRIRPSLIVVMVTAFGSNQIAVTAIKEGAYDFFNKPFEVEEMRVVVRRALEKRQFLRQISNLESRLKERLSFDRIIGQSAEMRSIYDIVEKVLSNDVTVLISGESGTGKELVAQAIHYHSPRKSNPFVSVNCAAIPEALLESELFGHERGAFTGAVGMKLGLFETANGGTVFLDEIGDMSLPLQSKLLRVLQEREVVRVGGTKPIKVDIRVVTATNRHLADCVEKKLFREDLYFRLNVLPIPLPPLRQRGGDIPLLARHFISVYNPRLNKAINGIEPDALQILESYRWPGNVRELENVIQRAMILATSTMITRNEIPSALLVAGGGGESGELGKRAEDFLISDFSVPLQEKVEKLSDALERKIIIAALRKANHRRQDTADLLGISRKSLHNKMVKHDLFTSRPSEDTESQG